MFILAFAMILSGLVISSEVVNADAYSGKANGKDISKGINVSNYCTCGIKMGVNGHWCCANYATKAYKYIWGEDYHYKNANNLLRNLNANDRKFTVDNMKAFFSQSKSGAIFRIDSDSNFNAVNTMGHSMIFVGTNKSNDGATFIEGNYDGTGRARIKEWKYKDLKNNYKNYPYIRYILWPNAPEYKSNASTIANSKITQIPGTISQGDAWTCDGTISSNYNLKYANGYIIKNTGKASMWNDEEKVYAIKGSDLKENTTKTYNLKNSAIDRGLLFNKLSPGNYYYVITARDMTDAPLQVIYKFSIVAKVSNNKPQGNVDSVVCDTSGKIHVQGWAYDPDSKSTALDIHVYVGGSASPSVPCTPIKANLERKDVNKVYGCGDYHGFNAQISASRTGNVDVYIYAIDTAGGENPLLGKRTVNVTAHTHNYNIAGNVTKQATCTENGTQVYKCSCGATTNKTIEKIGHTIVVDEAVSPTYTSDGLTEGSHCSKCNKVIVPQKVIPVLEYVQEYSKDDDVNYPDEKTKDDIINSPEDSKYDYTQDNNMSGNDQVKYEDKETLIKEEQGKNEQIQKDASINTPQKNVSEKENSSGSSNVSKNNNKKNTITKTNVNNNVHENAVEEDVFTIKNATYEIMSDNTVMFAYVNTNTVKSYTVPATVTYNGKKYKVTCIFDEAFMDCSTLKKVTIGKNVDEIGDDVFKNCNNLKNIIIKSTKFTKGSIGKNAFKGISKKATFKCPKKQLKNYKKWIKKAGAPKTTKYKKQ